MEALPAELMIDADKLRPGMYVLLDLSWMEHPFPLNRFKIATLEQVEQIKGLRLTKVKVLTARSDATAFDPVSTDAEAAPMAASVADASAASPLASLTAPKSPNRMALDRQSESLMRCERLFGEASAAWKQISTLSQREPQAAMQQSMVMVEGFVRELSGTQETSIRLLSEISGDGNALHALNVTLVSLLLGRAMKLDDTTLNDVGVGALLHDIGKQALPDRLRWRSDKFTAVEERAYREHVVLGLHTAARMGLSSGAQLVIAQHHEGVDGKGYPKGMGADRMTAAAKVVSLVNTYDNLCNTGVAAAASTPHEALSLMFAHLKPRFDPACLTAFIRLMGVYPPGSVVQLSDERFALVVSVNTGRPLKPTVLVFDHQVPRDEALLLDLQTEPSLGIRRSMHPRHLSSAALSYLSPRKRMSYFFEHNSTISDQYSGTAWVLDGGSAQDHGVATSKAKA